MAHKPRRMSAAKACAEIRQWLENESSSDEEIEGGLESCSDSDMEDVVETQSSGGESGEAAVETQSSGTDDSDTEVGNTASNGKDDSVADAGDVFLSRDKSLKWSKTRLSAVKGRRSKVNVVRAARSVNLRGQSVEKPTDAFDLYLDAALFDKLLKFTNEEAKRKRDRKQGHDVYYLRDFDMLELKACVGMLIMTGVMCSKRESLDGMWSNTLGRPVLRACMPLHRFREFLGCARFDDKGTRQERQATDKLAAIRELFDSFVDKCQALYTPSPYVCIDETLVGFRGRCPFRVYIPSKPDRYGLKIWSMCDVSSCYLCNLQVYLGKEGDSAEQQQGARVVRDLATPVYGSGRNITTDNFFTSHALAKFLLGQNLTLLGTVRKTRKELPNEFVLKKRKAFESIFAFTEDTTLVSYAPKTDKTVVLLSTMHNKEEINTESEKKKPQMILDYNATKGAVDTFDKMVKSYTCARSTRRWPMRLFFFLMDAACLNASVVWFMTHPDWKRKESHKRRSFLSAVAYDMMKPMIDYRSQSANISHMPTVSRAMLAIGVEPVASTSAQTGSKKRGRCQSCPRSQEQKVEHRCTKCQQFVCGKHGKKTIVYNCVVCPLRLRSDTRDDE